MQTPHRRRFLKFLAGSPLFASVLVVAWRDAAFLANPKRLAQRDGV
jgi:hypothetical protein